MQGVPPPSNSTVPPMIGHRLRHMMMHMTFFWGRDSEILFDGWPGYGRPGMYILALAVVFLLAIFVEWLSHCNIVRKPARQGRAAAGLLQTIMYGVRIGLAYLVMLAVMSFNAGVFLAAIAGHVLGFFFIGSLAFEKPAPPDSTKTTDLPPMSCC
ncbi:copper transporter 6-like [Dorcoceras hygrometricum]|uniref:Copper transport protein n=1 Tax=Dorcoceras hygrometricum TaxID=472368 RepID=A0A2Z7CND0_9LAMI|nr:copper transporter 6-like [Dorcoceras hygrometricum]